MILINGKVKRRRKGVRPLSNPKRFPEDFVPNHIGTQPRESNSNNGKKMANKSHDHADYVPPKGK